MLDRLKEAWALLNRPIYTGDRLRENLGELTAVGLFTAAMGLILLIVNLSARETSMLIASASCLLGGLVCAYFAGVRKNRALAALIPTLFCLVAFTVYAVMGLGDGTAVLFSLLVPLVLCFFVSVRNGILVSCYYSLFFLVLFYTPLRRFASPYYSDAFMLRFPLVYLFMTGFTAISMFQYHRGVLLENEYSRRLKEEVARQTAVAENRSRRIEEMSLQTIQTLANAIDAKDPCTKGHSTRVSQYAVMIAEALGWEEERINDLRYAALLHDIGNIGVPDSILNNPKRLTDVEFDIIKSHTTMGADILKNRIMIRAAEDVARSHHEQYDGSGYPMGLKGEEIPEEARIVAVADAFDAMSSNRVYRRACSSGYIHSELLKARGKQLDPHFTDVFLDLWDRGRLAAISSGEPLKRDGIMEASSVLLREVMEAFLAQNLSDRLDSTTGIMNRTAGEAAIVKMMQEAAGCLVFLDLDNLKTLNDTNGHEFGDRALRLVGVTLKERCENGLCCRLGGDEFLVFLKDVSREEAQAWIEGFYGEFDRKKQADPGFSVVTLSAGLVMCTPRETYSKMYRAADKALYHVKQNGKNSFSFYSGDTDPEESEALDVNRLVDGIQESGNYEGALDVDYRHFTKLYEYVCHLEKRFSCPFKLILITLESEEDESLPEELERAMYFMEASVRQAIRNVDVFTRYGRQSFLIILLGTSDEGVKIAMDRVFRSYYKMNGGSLFAPSYHVAALDGETETQ